MKTIFAANWKMNKTVEQSLDFIKALNRDEIASDKQVIIFPSSVSLKPLSDATSLALGAQNIHYESSGAFTGEISADQAKSAGAQYVLIGHSERRSLFSETNEDTGKKLKAAFLSGLIPILCVGETLDQRKKGETMQIIKEQLDYALKEIDTKKIIIAYEPVWAIGTGESASAKQAQDVHQDIKNHLRGYTTQVLYGGSVKPSNAAELLSQADIDGVLVGGASLDPEEFFSIITAH